MLAPDAITDGEGGCALGFYHQLNRLRWPKSFLGRLILVCATTYSVPLFAFLAVASVMSARGNAFGLETLAAVIAANCVGFGLMLMALRRLLVPVQLSIAALDSYRRNGCVPELPCNYDDEPGRLMREIRTTIAGVESTFKDLALRADTDPLTEIANRRAFMREGNERLLEAARSGDVLSVVVLDIDRFKAVNDTFGHAAGDGVLRIVTSRIERTLRSGAAFARVGGEEFAILLPCTGLADALEVAERLRVAISSLPLPPLCGGHVTASFGVTGSDAADSGIEAVLRRADEALYDAKRAGRNRVAFRRTSGERHDEPFASIPVPVTLVATAGLTSDGVWLVD